LRRDDVVENDVELVLGAQLEVGSRERRLLGQFGARERCLAGLRAGAAALDIAADLAPYVDRPVTPDADAVGGLGTSEHRAEAGRSAHRTGAATAATGDGTQP